MSKAPICRAFGVKRATLYDTLARHDLGLGTRGTTAARREAPSLTTVSEGRSILMAVPTSYQFLEARPRSHYRQLWVKGRHVRAEVLYRCTVGAEPRTPREVTQDYDLPLAAAVQHEALLTAERTREATRMQATGLDHPPALPAAQPTSA